MPVKLPPKPVLVLALIWALESDVRVNSNTPVRFHALTALFQIFWYLAELFEVLIVAVADAHLAVPCGVIWAAAETVIELTINNAVIMIIALLILMSFLSTRNTSFG